MLVTREELSKNALGRELTVYDRSLDVHISNLRKKLGLLRMAASASARFAEPAISTIPRN